MWSVWRITGQLKPLAFSMDELKAELEKEYGERVMRAPEKTVGKGSMEDGAKVNEEAGERGEVPEKKTFWAAADPEQDFWNDVASGEWIFGRGAADMKGGLAAGLAVLLGIGEEVLDGTCGMDGNVLFLSVPGRGILLRRHARRSRISRKAPGTGKTFL